MRIKIQKWGNSLAMRIPKAFAFQSNIKEDEYVNLTLENDRIIVEPEIEKTYTLEELVAGINHTNLHNEADFGKKTGAEIW